jgi:hypothetical protein
VQEPDTMRDGGLGKLHKKMRRFGDTLNPEDAYLSCECCSSSPLLLRTKWI